MSLSPAKSSVEASSPLTSSYGLPPPLPLSSEPSFEIWAYKPGTYFLQIIVYALHHSSIHFHAGLMAKSARDDKDVSFFHLMSPDTSESIRKDHIPLYKAHYKLIPIPIFICESQLSELHHFLGTTTVPYYHTGPEWLHLALNRLERCGFLPKWMGARCYSRMCSAIKHYSSGVPGIPWDSLRGEVHVDILDGPTQVVVLKQPLADGLSLSC